MVNTMKKSMERSTFDPRGMLWVQLLNAGRLALRPARIGLSMLLLLLMALMWWLPTLWIEGEETPSYWVMEFSGEAFRAIQSGLLSLDAGKVHAGVKELFIAWLEGHFPDRKDKVLNGIRAMRGGKLNDSNFETRMRGQGVWAEQVRAIFHLHRKRLGFPEHRPPLAVDHFRRPGTGQLSLW